MKQNKNDPKTSFFRGGLKHDGINVGAVVGGGLLAGLIGSIVLVCKQVANISITPTIKLDDPPCPNMEQLAPFLADEFRNYKGAFYKLCPDELKDIYSSYVRKAINKAEYIMCIQVQLMRKEKPRQRIYYDKCYTASLECMKMLEAARGCLGSEVVEDMYTAEREVSVLLSDQIHNVNNITTDIYPGHY
jgi:hypothetical protein